MKPLKVVFEEQQRVAQVSRDALPHEERALIRFSIAGSVFAVDISKVIEVTELHPVVRYPEDHFGHLGIVNLRGNVVPVLTFRDQSPEDACRSGESRLIVLEFAPGRRFSTMVSAPKKVSLNAGGEHAEENIVSIDGAPARILSEKDFPAAQIVAEEGSQHG